jgi:hypothetical protein
MTKKPKAIDNYEDLCFKCLKKGNITHYVLCRDEYGSSFDGVHTHLQLCDECKKEVKDEWFNEEPKIDDYFTRYKYEKNILDFIETLPIEGKELFWNRCASGACTYYMEPQDWIDYELGILPHDKCIEYNLYSPDEIKAYKERFPVCQHPVNIIYNDNYKSCRCPFGAFGEYGQKIGLNIWDDCYECKHFIKRSTPIKNILSKDYDNYEIYYKSKILAKEYKENSRCDFMQLHNDAIIDKTLDLKFCTIKLLMRKDNGSGRFDGGWSWKLGFQIGGKTLLISLLVIDLMIKFK